MNLIRQKLKYTYNNVPKFVLYSTQTLKTSKSNNINNNNNNLFYRVHRAGNDPKICIKRVLNEWVNEGKQIQIRELQALIKQLRSRRRFAHALQVSEWMCDEQNHDLTVGDTAIRLDLMSRSHGLVRAEEFFDSIPDNLRSLQVYNALLNCYGRYGSFDQAKAVFNKMKDLGFAIGSMSFNAMLRLYYKTKNYEKLDSLMQEMEEKGVPFDLHTFSVMLNAYAAAPDVENIEKLILKMEADPSILMNWNIYFAAASGFVKAGIIKKAVIMLKKSEQLLTNKTPKKAYDMFLTLYASLGLKDEVFCIWKLYKKQDRIYNCGYLSMISSLVKLDDIEGAENIYDEWESTHGFFDIRIPNMLLTKYCREGLLEKAEAFVKRLIDNGKEPNASTWDRLATGYQSHGQLGKAVDAVKKAISSESRPGWKPNLFTLAECLKYLKNKGDMETAEEILRSLREEFHLSSEVIEKFEYQDQREGHDTIQDKEKNEAMEFKSDSGSVI